MPNSFINRCEKCSNCGKLHFKRDVIDQPNGRKKKVKMCLWCAGEKPEETRPSRLSFFPKTKNEAVLTQQLYDTQDAVELYKSQMLFFKDDARWWMERSHKDLGHLNYWLEQYNKLKKSSTLPPSAEIEKAENPVNVIQFRLRRKTDLQRTSL